MMNEPGCYAEGGEASDDENLMNHVALECMHAIEAKDKEGFVSALHVLVADLLTKMESQESKE